VLAPGCEAVAEKSPVLRCESVDLQDFFNKNGVMIPDSPRNWVLLASLRRPLSRRPAYFVHMHPAISEQWFCGNIIVERRNARRGIVGISSAFCRSTSGPRWWSG